MQSFALNFGDAHFKILKGKYDWTALLFSSASGTLVKW